MYIACLGLVFAFGFGFFPFQGWGTVQDQPLWVCRAKHENFSASASHSRPLCFCIATVLCTSTCLGTCHLICNLLFLIIFCEGAQRPWGIETQIHYLFINYSLLLTTCYNIVVCSNVRVTLSHG